MATQQYQLNESTGQEITMPYVVINATNSYDPANNTRYATQAEADTRARDVLNQFPFAKVFIAQVIKEYQATVTIVATDPEVVESGE